MHITVKKNRKVIVVGNGNTTKAGIKNENKVENIDFEFPDEYHDFNKVLFFKDIEGNIDFDLIQNNQYIIERNITTKGKVLCQVACMNAEVTEENIQNEDTIIFESEIFSLTFSKSIIENADELISDDEVSLINTLVDQLNEEIDKVKDLEIEVDNIDIDVNKEGSTATVEITKKDGTTKTVEIEDGEHGQNGTDYIITSQDYQEIAEIVKQDIFIYDEQTQTLTITISSQEA